MTTSPTSSRSSTLRRLAAALVAGALLAAACSSGDDTTATDTTDTDTTDTDTTDTDTTTTTSDGATEGDATSTTVDATTTTEQLAGPAPGVTDDAITIGVTYVDTASLVAVGLDYDLGEHRAVYQALFDDINAGGGVHGRQLEPVYAAINPTNALSADEVCLELTEDVDAFLVTGFFLDDAVLCPVDLHATAVVGGGMTPARLEEAQAPWVTWLPDTDQPVSVVKTMAERGELEGSVAVYAATADQEDMDDLVLPALAELGIEPVATAILDAPPDDPALLQTNVGLIGERFEREGADTIVLVGASAATWPQYMADNESYRPKLLFLELTAARAFATSAANADTSILDGSLSAGGYGPDQARFEEAAMQECVEVLAAAGLETPAPSGFDPDDRSNQPYQAAFQACPDVVIVRSLLEAAGENLNYATLAAAIDGLEVHVPGDPSPRTFGPPPDGDGDPDVYFFAWDDAERGFVLDES